MSIGRAVLRLYYGSKCVEVDSDRKKELQLTSLRLLTEFICPIVVAHDEGPASNASIRRLDPIHIGRHAIGKP